MALRTGALRSAALGGLVLVLAGCGSAGSARPASTAGASGVSTFRNDFVALRYPAAWRPFVFRQAEVLHFDPMLYLSSQQAHTPCRARGASTVCGWPVDRLQPGGALVEWENRGYPGWSLAAEPGTELRVGGRRAKQTVARPGSCAAIGADETIRIDIERPLPENWTAVTACLRGPGLKAGERRVGELLASTRFLAP